jgi:hypothetical protein
MKNTLKTAFCLLFIFGAILPFLQSAFAQILQTHSPAFNDFHFKITELTLKVDKRFEKKDFKHVELLSKEILTLAENIQLPDIDMDPKFEQFVNSVKTNAYYSLACSQSQLNKKKEAISSFEKAVEFGYSEYHYAKRDSNLDNIRKDKRFIALLNTIKQHTELFVLQNSGPYKYDSICLLPKFVYQSANDRFLQEVKNYFDLEFIAGNGDEISKIKNLLFFVAKSVGFDGSHRCLCELDAIDIYNYYQVTGRGVDCRSKAIMMNEIFLAMGFKSRYVTCMPKDPKDPHNHVINCVYSQSLKKWLYVDPSFGVYITDDNDNMLSVGEVRERIKNGLPLVLNPEFEHAKEWYIDRFMAKYLYQIKCLNFFRFNNESDYREWDKSLLHITLLPLDFDKNNPYIQGDIITHDPDCFWLPPEEE